MHLTLPAGPWSGTSECCLLTFRVWLAQGVSDTLCPSVWVKDSAQLPFHYFYLPFFFQFPLREWLGALPMVSSHMQSVDLGVTGVLCMCRALDPPGCLFLYTWNIPKCWHQSLPACVTIAGG